MKKILIFIFFLFHLTGNLYSQQILIDDLEFSKSYSRALNRTYWRNYRIFPMGCNIQLIFYRPKKGNGDILVKALLNEREAYLPIKTTQWPYYNWKELRQYYLNKIK